MQVLSWPILKPFINDIMDDRFRFLAVRDVKSTSRLQVGSIDLYAKQN